MANKTSWQLAESKHDNVASEIGMKSEADRQQLHRMLKSQLLEKIGHGQYVPKVKRDAGHTVTTSHQSQSPESVTM